MNTTHSQNFPDAHDLSSHVETQTVSAQRITMERVGEHTPGPYFPAEFAPGMWEIVVSEKPYSPAVAYLSIGTFLPSGTPEANARFIARACSSHYELLSDLEVIRIIATTPHHPDALTAIREIADKRIWAATGKETAQ